MKSQMIVPLLPLLLFLLHSTSQVLGQFMSAPADYYWQQPDYSQHQQSNSGNTRQQQHQQFISAPSSIYGQWAQPQQYYFQQPPSHHQQQQQHGLPYASYRSSAFAAPSVRGVGVDQAQREKLARIADETESFGSLGRIRPSGFFDGQMVNNQQQQHQGDGLQRILASFAEKLPKIAETMAKLGGGGNTIARESTANASPAPQKEKFVVEEFDGDGGEVGSSSGGRGISLSRREYEIDAHPSPDAGAERQQQLGAAGLINSMPEPSSLFSFNKLLSAFGAGQGEKTPPAGQMAGDGFDLKGTPILKSEDLDPGTVARNGAKEEEQVLFSSSNRGPRQQQHLTPPPELPPTGQNQNPLNSFLQHFGIPMAATGTPKSGREADKEGQQQEESGDLFGSLMKGKLPQMPDWLRQFGIDGMLGQNGGGPKGGPEEPGNALAQLFGGGGGKAGGKGGFGLGSVLGSGLDDAPRLR